MINISEYESTPYITVNGTYINCDEFFRSDIINGKYQKTLAGVNGNDILDKTKRVSLTYNSEFIINLSNDGLEFICENKLKDDNKWKLLKYEIDGFFKNHIDKLGAYTALLFPPNNFDLKGGDLIFNMNTLQEIIIKPESFTKYTLVIFPISMYHEVTPVENGTRYVFKKALFDSREKSNEKGPYEGNKSEEILAKNKTDEYEDDTLDDGGFTENVFLGKGGDY